MTQDDTDEPQDEVVDLCPDCGKPDGSFACKIRHINMNAGEANSKREWEADRRKTASFKRYGI